MSTASEMEMMAHYANCRLQGVMQGMKPLLDELTEHYMALIARGVFLPLASKNSRLLASRNRREGRYAGKVRPCGYKPNWDVFPKRHGRTGANPYDMWMALKPYHWPSIDAEAYP